MPLEGAACSRMIFCDVSEDKARLAESRIKDGCRDGCSFARNGDSTGARLPFSLTISPGFIMEMLKTTKILGSSHCLSDSRSFDGLG